MPQQRADRARPAASASDGADPPGRTESAWQKGGASLIYVIKFIYGWLLPPGLFVLLLALAAIWQWRRKARRPALTAAGIGLLAYALSLPPVGGLLLGALEGVYGQPAVASLRGDVIVVLGGGASQATPDLDGRGNLYGSAANRLLTAVRLHRATGLPILFSGGQVFADTGNEADIARRQLLALGVADRDIIVENRSLNTRQNAEYTAQLLKEKGLVSPILVTSAFHMPRAMIEFGHVGAEAAAFPTDYHISRGARRFYAGQLVPSAEGLSNTSAALKEYIGVAAARIRG